MNIIVSLFRNLLKLQSEPPSGESDLDLKIQELIRLGKHHEIKALSNNNSVFSKKKKPKICRNIGIEYTKQKMPDLAIEYLQTAVKLIKDDAELLFYYALAQNDLGHEDLAAEYYKKCLILKPDYADALNNLGIIYLNNRDFIQAEEQFSKILGTNSNHIQALYNLAYVKDMQCNYDGAISGYNQVLSISPDNHNALFNKSMLELVTRRYQEGFKNFRARPSALFDNNIPDAVLLDQNLHGKRILLLSEMGIGEELFFLRFCHFINEWGGSADFVASKKVAPILLGNNVVDNVFTKLPEVNNYDYVISVIDLPYALQFTNPYEMPGSLTLNVSEEVSAEVRQVLSTLGDGPFLGVTWRAGNSKSKNGKPWIMLDKNVSMASLCEPLADYGCLVPVQRGISLEEREFFTSKYQHLFEFLERAYDDLGLMLALMSELNEYVCVSNSHFYLREAVGKKSHVLVTCPADWRWNNTSNSDWFPDTPVYRLKENNDPASVMENLLRNLNKNCTNIQ